MLQGAESSSDKINLPSTIHLILLILELPTGSHVIVTISETVSEMIELFECEIMTTLLGLLQLVKNKILKLQRKKSFLIISNSCLN
jgi:hypothetical protein